MDKIKRGIYRHFKGNFYEVLGTAIHSETLEKFIVYKTLYNSKKFGKNAIWIRSIKNFAEKVLINGKKIPRFKYLGKSNKTFKKTDN